MPQYKQSQYGLSQYGYYLPSGGGGEVPGLGGKWSFIRSRMAVVRKGEQFWLYQHTPVSLKGKQSLLRIQSSQGETLYRKIVQAPGRPFQLRIKTNVHPHQSIETQTLTKEQIE